MRLKPRKILRRQVVGKRPMKGRCEMKRHGLIVSTALAALLVVLVSPALCGERELLGELRTLVDEQDETFLLGEIRRIQPFYSIRRLARFQKNQDLVGGGFCGCLPGQLMNAGRDSAAGRRYRCLAGRCLPGRAEEVESGRTVSPRLPHGASTNEVGESATGRRRRRI